MCTGSAYIRVSTDEQLEFSPDSQLKKIQEYAKSQGICLPEANIYREEGISGREAEKRPAFQKMIGAAKSTPRPFDVILVWKFSRFARSRSDSIFYKTLLRNKLGIDILSVSEPIGKDKTSKIYESIIEVMDEYYCDNLSEEVRRGMDERFSRGMIIAPPPYGYTAENGKYVPDEGRAQIVQYMFQAYASGVPLRAIAADLNERGVRTKRGGPFEVRTVRYILNNPVYLGFVRKKNTDGSFRLVGGEHIPLIDADLYDACVNKLKNNSFQPQPYVRTGGRFALSGLIRCSACGSILTMSSRSGRLQCCGYAKGKCSVSHSVALEQIHTAAVRQLSKDLSGRQIRIRTNPLPLRGETDESMLRREKMRMRRIEQAYEAGVYTLEYLLQAKQTYKEKEKICKEKKRDNVSGTMDVTLDMSSFIQYIMAYPDGAFANAVLKSLLSKIVFFRPESTLKLYYRSDL